MAKGVMHIYFDSSTGRRQYIKKAKDSRLKPQETLRQLRSNNRPDIYSFPMGVVDVQLQDGKRIDFSAKDRQDRQFQHDALTWPEPVKGKPLGGAVFRHRRNMGRF